MRSKATTPTSGDNQLDGECKMAAVAEYYKTDFSYLVRLEAQWSATVNASLVQKFETSVLLDFGGNAKYLAFYFPQETSDGNLLI